MVKLCPKYRVHTESCGELVKRLFIYDSEGCL